jgi:hypothetical protein
MHHALHCDTVRLTKDTILATTKITKESLTTIIYHTAT